MRLSEEKFFSELSFPVAGVLGVPGERASPSPPSAVNAFCNSKENHLDWLKIQLGQVVRMKWVPLKASKLKSGPKNLWPTTAPDCGVALALDTSESPSSSVAVKSRNRYVKFP